MSINNNIKVLIDLCKTTVETVGDVTVCKELPESTLEVVHEMIREVFNKGVQPKDFIVNVDRFEIRNSRGECIYKLGVNTEQSETNKELTKGVVMNIEWSEEFEANTDIRYNHIIANTPVGEFSVQWKGWKEWDSKCVYLNDKYLNSFCEIDEAKEFVSEYLIGLYNKLGEML